MFYNVQTCCGWMQTQVRALCVCHCIVLCLVCICGGSDGQTSSEFIDSVLLWPPSRDRTTQRPDTLCCVIIIAHMSTTRDWAGVCCYLCAVPRRIPQHRDYPARRVAHHLNPVISHLSTCVCVFGNAYTHNLLQPPTLLWRMSRYFKATDQHFSSMLW